MLEGILTFLIVGFLAQMIDGALGMAYGVSSNSFLLGMGVSPAVASSSIHTAEVFTTLISGISHWKVGNVNLKLFKRLVIPGMVGGFLGAYILSNFPGDKLKPFIALYLLIMGSIILWKAFNFNKVNAEKKIDKAVPLGLVGRFFNKVNAEKKIDKAVPLGLVGGFFDAIGGGGWGPIVTSTLVAKGKNPRMAIGSVNSAEFFVTVVETITFFFIIGLSNWQTILGLIIGGVIAAPFAAILCKKLPPRTLMIIVGVLIMILSLRTIYLAL